MPETKKLKWQPKPNPKPYEVAWVDKTYEARIRTRTPTRTRIPTRDTENSKKQGHGHGWGHGKFFFNLLYILKIVLTNINGLSMN